MCFPILAAKGAAKGGAPGWGLERTGADVEKRPAFSADCCLPDGGEALKFESHTRRITGWGAMGEDGLILQIEDEFGIAIADDEACRAQTARDLHAIVVSKLEAAGSCLDAIVFYRTRKALAETLGVASRTIGPMTRLEALMPQESRIEQWKQLSKRSGLEFPALTHTKRWKDRFVLISMVGAVFPVALLWWSLYALGWLPGILVWLFAGPAFVAWVVLISRINQKLLDRTPRLAYDLPFMTAGELAVSVLALNEERLEQAADEMHLDGLDEEMVWTRMAKVVGREMHVDPRTVPPGMRIGADVGVR